jgi:hypothetical protein
MRALPISLAIFEKWYYGLLGVWNAECGVKIFPFSFYSLPSITLEFLIRVSSKMHPLATNIESFEYRSELLP